MPKETRGIRGEARGIRVTRVSVLTGLAHEFEINTTIEKLVQWEQGDTTKLIQDFFPELSDEEREFLLTGITPDEWVNALGPEE